MMNVLLIALLSFLAHSRGSNRVRGSVQNVIANSFFVPVSDPPTQQTPIKHYKNGEIDHWNCYCPQANTLRSQKHKASPCEIYLTTWALAGKRPDQHNRYVAMLDSNHHTEVEQLITFTAGGNYILALDVGLTVKSQIRSLLKIYLDERNVFVIDIKEQQRKRYRVMVRQVTAGDKSLRIVFQSKEKSQQCLISDLFFGRKAATWPAQSD